MSAHATAVPLYPLLLEPIYKKKVWGGRGLERLGRALPGGPDVRIGESWEVADLARSSASGGGGGPERSRVAEGALAGRTLGELLAERPAEVLGSAEPAGGGAFPLLAKYLDARENLSVQVHPTSAYVARHPGAHLKSEAWYVVHADPGAVLYLGLEPGTTTDDLAAALRAGTVSDLLAPVTAVPRACHYLPSGICHALGGGVVVAEIQTPSDSTFRLYDWGRTEREMHVEEALETVETAARDERADPPARDERTSGAARPLVRCEHFNVDEWSDEEGRVRRLPLVTATVLMVVSGALEVLAQGRAPVRVVGGRTVLLPAALEQAECVARERSTVLCVALPEVGAAAS